MEVSKCWKILEFQKNPIKMKNCKSFYEAQTVSCLKEIIQPPPIPNPFLSDKILLRLWKKNYGDIQKYTDIYFESASEMQFFGVKKWCRPNVFSNTKQKHGWWKICKVRKVFDCVSMSSELRFLKWVRFFERNCIVKWVIFFANFCSLCNFLLENLKIKKKMMFDDVFWNVWANIKVLHARNNIFKKIILNMRFRIIYNVVQI